MRQISIRELKAKLSAEIKNLPLAVTNNGRIVAYIMADCGQNDEKDEVKIKSACNAVEDMKIQVAELVKKKKIVVTQETDSCTGPVHYFNPCPKKNR